MIVLIMDEDLSSATSATLQRASAPLGVSESAQIPKNLTLSLQLGTIRNMCCNIPSKRNTSRMMYIPATRNTSPLESYRRPSHTIMLFISETATSMKRAKRTYPLSTLASKNVVMRSISTGLHRGNILADSTQKPLAKRPCIPLDCTAHSFRNSIYRRPAKTHYALPLDWARKFLLEDCRQQPPGNMLGVHANTCRPISPWLAYGGK